MNISPAQISNLKAAIQAGLRGFYRPPVLTCAEYADSHFYMSSESSYSEGRWESLFFQVGILNAMGNDQIRIFNCKKSARVGYTKMLMANGGYKVEHKKRNVLIYQPKDGAAKSFMKKHVETAIRDMPIWRKLAPWMGKKHKDNTLEDKVFTNGKTLMVRGGTAAANYREISTDDVIYDELAAFDESIEREGNATSLGDTRIELSVFPKSIRGSTPKNLGSCQIEKACNDSSHYFELHLPCPHCGELQTLKWGGKDEPFGIKWINNDPKTAEYACEHNGCLIQNNELDDMGWHPDAKWICAHTGMYTSVGDKKTSFIEFFDKDGQPCPTPESVSIHIWSGYNPLNSWHKLAGEFYKAKDDREKLQTFVNTKLGQPWDDDTGEKLDWEELGRRKEMYQADIPEWVVYLTAGVDTQDDRYEGRIWGWGAGKECALIDRFILNGDPANEILLSKVAERLSKSYTRVDGIIMNVGLTCWDSGGHYTDTVYSMSRKLGVMKVIPIRGAPVYGKPIANFPKKKNRARVYLTEVGTDNAKELIMSMFRIEPDVNVRKSGAVHLPLNSDICDDEELQQLTSERKIPVTRNGRTVYRWDNQKRRNEALDCFVYAVAALHIAQQRFGVDLEQLTKQLPTTQLQVSEPENNNEPTPKQAQTVQPKPSNQWLNNVSNEGWL
ncbi:phage terminase large subunit family protein [Parashewanella curva]|uniref:Phage terminase large subunit family protein n=1 Tax=Parashewanella curva TaxID=2338552 RepID=A0A3L8Q2A2_9GAMM|nr:terminase gpA endonuclease subunit [Parashewanella curva]RLV60998.1 phage terminase large subunit family protein [Parashewanella curva]